MKPIVSVLLRDIVDTSENVFNVFSAAQWHLYMLLSVTDKICYSTNNNPRLLIKEKKSPF